MGNLTNRGMENTGDGWCHEALRVGAPEDPANSQS